MPGPNRFRFALPLAAVLLYLHSTAVLAAPGRWDTFMDGTLMTGLAADSDGRVWASSSGGATAFDPADSSTLRLFHNDGLQEQDLTSIAIDADGNRWYGSRSRGLQAQSATTSRFLRRPLDQFDLGSDSVRALLPVGDSLWVGLASGAALVSYPPDPEAPQGAVLLTFNIEAFLGQSPLVNSIAVLADTTWFATQRGVVRREPDGSRSLINSGLANLDVRALTFFDGFLWAGTATSVFRLEDPVNGMWVERANGLRRGRPLQAFAIFEGALHVGTQADTASVYRLDAGLMTWSGRSLGVSDRNVVAMAPIGGQLWAATSRGIYRLGTGDLWQRIPSPDPPAPTGLSFNADYRDVAIVPGTTNERAVTRVFLTTLGPSGWIGIGRGRQGIENRDFSRVLVDSRGRTWLAHCCCGQDSTCGLDRLDDLSGNAVAYPAFNLLGLVEAPDGAIWGGSVATDIAGYGLYHIDPATGDFDNYTTATVPLFDNSIQALAFDANGALWIGHASGGVDIWSNPGEFPTSITHLGTPQGLPNLVVNALVARENEVWVGTASGIAIFSGVQHLRTIPGATLPDPQVLDLAVDGCGRVWAATPRGLVELDGENGSIVIVYDDDLVPGVVDERANRLDVDLSTGTIGLATVNGLSRFSYDRGCSQASGASARRCTRLCPYPNPFDPGSGDFLGLTDVGPTGPVHVAVIDLAGREVWSRRIDSGAQVWNGLDSDGDPVPSGLYLLRIETEGGRGTEGPVFRPLAVRR